MGRINPVTSDGGLLYRIAESGEHGIDAAADARRAFATAAGRSLNLRVRKDVSKTAVQWFG